jgi:hypothetical protein
MLRYAYSRDPSIPTEQGSAGAYGTVVHHACHVMERMWDAPKGEVDPKAVATAVSTFNHFWHPDNIHELTDPVDFYYPRQSWAGLRARGEKCLRDYAELRKNEDVQVLGLEYPFEVPVAGTDHTISGFVDRFGIKKFKGKPYLSLDDLKTGKQPAWLRHHVQGHVYAYATTQPEFWEAFANGPQLHAAFASYARRFRWIDLKNIKYVDGGWRSEQDYHRLALACNEVARSVEAGIYPPSLSGDTCTFCDYRAICGDVPLPADDEGAPA